MSSAANLAKKHRLAFRGWMPIALMGVLIVAVGGYTQSQSSAFLSEFNLNGLLIATIPLALAAMGQTSALMVRAFDVSVGALMTVCVVVASFTLVAGEPWYVLLPGAFALIGVGLAVGLFNAFLIKVLGLSSIIATLATLSILQGIALWLRPTPEGVINPGVIDALLKSVGFIPIAFIGVVVVAVFADMWLYRSVGGLTARAVGLDETSAGRRRARVGYIFVRALFLSALAASVGAFFLAAQVGVGDPRVGLGFTLTSIAAAVLGGASLVGGRGSFVGAVVGALFLNVIVNILPFLGWNTAYGRMLVGGLTLLALALYQSPELATRLRTAVSDFRTSRSSAKPATPLE